jgi:methylenetetrahydrofolate--tRNA-(uracil-5-)-methyltransferase
VTDIPKKDEDGRRLRGKEKSRLKKQLMAKKALATLINWRDDNPIEQQSA